MDHAYANAAIAEPRPTSPSRTPTSLSPVAAPPRHDIYAFIHKGLRAALTDALLAVGRLDSGDPVEVSQAVAGVRDLLEFCRDHLETENAFVHTAMEARRPGSTRRIGAEHVEHAAAIAALQGQVEALARSPAASRGAIAARLYRDLARFVGDNFVHMYVEEVEHNRVLWAIYSDTELCALESEIKAHLPPAAMLRALRWMLPAMTPAERGGMLRAMREGAPAPVFGGVLSLARDHVDERGWRKLEAALAD